MSDEVDDMHSSNDCETGFRDARAPLLGRSWHRLAPDIEIAARSKLPVLVSGRPEAALTIARAIANAAHLDPVGDVHILDAVSGDDLLMTPTARSIEHGRGAVLVLREVHRFSPPQQADVVELLALGREHPAARLRIVATSSVSLIDHVVDGTFDERLFYALNAVHIMV
jgi:hypothetical protein